MLAARPLSVFALVALSSLSFTTAQPYKIALPDPAGKDNTLSRIAPRQEDGPLFPDRGLSAPEEEDDGLDEDGLVLLPPDERFGLCFSGGVSQQSWLFSRMPERIER
jgi:hypothetical protein